MLHTKNQVQEYVSREELSLDKDTSAKRGSCDATSRPGRRAITQNSDEYTELVSFARNLRRVKRRLFLQSVMQTTGDEYLPSVPGSDDTALATRTSFGSED